MSVMARLRLYLIVSTLAAARGFTRAATRRPRLLGRDGQALAALLTAALQHQAAVLRAHPDQESVGTPATALVRLKCTFHGIYSEKNRRTAEPQILAGLSDSCQSAVPYAMIVSSGLSHGERLW